MPGTPKNAQLAVPDFPPDRSYSLRAESNRNVLPRITRREDRENLVTSYVGRARAACRRSVDDAYAHAACGLAPPALKPIAWDSVTDMSELRPAVFHQGTDGGRFLLTSDDWDPRDQATIVGIWRFELLGSDDSVVDDGHAQ
jgi:hypothetical protein